MSVLSAHVLPVLRQLSPEVFISGEEISQRLGCSRATVHNAIRAARDAGFVVHAVHGRGYRLASPASWLDAERLGRDFARRDIALRHFDQIGSTNAELLRWAALDAPSRALVSTEWQGQGRGRRGRDWHAGLGGGLAFSFLWRSARSAARIAGLSLAVGVSLVKSLRAMGLERAQVKWPNDIQVDGAKLAGVLIELASDGLANDVMAPCTAVIGVGINVSGGEALSRRVGQPVTDLQSHLGLIDRNDLLLRLIAGLDADLARFEREGFSAFHAAWQACHAHQGLTVSMLAAQGEMISGTALGVDAHGALLLETPSGIQAFHSGEVSLRVLPA